MNNFIELDHQHSPDTTIKVTVSPQSISAMQIVTGQIETELEDSSGERLTKDAQFTDIILDCGQRLHVTQTPEEIDELITDSYRS